MDTNIAHKIARAFVHGLAFAKGMTTLAQDAKAKMEEGDKWITIGAEPGDDGKKHGGRHVLISGTGEVKKGLSKSAQGKPLGEAIKELKDKAESKKAENKKAELNRKLKEGEKAGNIQFPRNEFRERAKAYTEQANQVINDDLKPSVDKLGSAIRKNTDNARMPQSTLDDLNDIHNLAKQIGPMASKLNKYNEKYAAEHDDPSNYVISNYGAATKGTAERAASLTRRAAAMSNQLTAPDDERDYSEGRAKQEIRDILTEMRGLHGDLLKKTRHAATAFKTEKPSNSESDRVDAMYAQKGPKDERLINGPATATEPQSKSVSLSADDKKALKQIKDLVPEIGPVFHQAKSDLEFYSPSEKRKILKEVRFPDAEVTENIKYLNKLEEYAKREKEVRALAKDLNAAIKSGKLTPDNRNIYVRNLKYGFDELTKGIQRGAHAMYNYAERANREGYVSRLDDQWIKRAVEQARGGWVYIKWTANALKELK